MTIVLIRFGREDIVQKCWVSFRQLNRKAAIALGKLTSLLGFQPPTPLNPIQDSQSLKGFQSKAFRHFVKMSDRELRTHQSTKSLMSILRR